MVASLAKVRPETVVASLAKVRAERLDAIDTSLRAGEPGKRGELGPLRSWALRLMHSRVRRESSGQKVVSVVDAESSYSKGLAQQLRVLSHSLDHLRGKIGYSYKGDGKHGINCAVS